MVDIQDFINKNQLSSWNLIISYLLHFFLFWTTINLAYYLPFFTRRLQIYTNACYTSFFWDFVNPKPTTLFFLFFVVKNKTNHHIQTL